MAYFKRLPLGIVFALVGHLVSLVRATSKRSSVSQRYNIFGYKVGASERQVMANDQ